MPNLMQEITKNFSSIQTLVQLKNDATEIKKSLMTTYQSTSVRVSELKRNNRHVRSLFSWLSNKTDPMEEDQSPLLDDDTEFDAGFRYQTDEDTESSKPLGMDDMKSITSTQTDEMFKITRHSLDSRIQMTTEILNVVDNRSSEIIATLRSIDSAEKQLIQKLDAIIESPVKTNESENRYNKFSYKGSIIDASSGHLTLSSVKNFMANNVQHVSNSLFGTLLDYTRLRVMDKALTEAIQSAQTNVLLKLFELPVMKRYYNLGSGGKDYSTFVNTDTYNTEPAVFDGMVRKSIITVIPDYLRQITEFVTGKRLNINDYGDLTQRDTTTDFAKAIDVTFDTTAFRDRPLEEFISNTTKSESDINSADMREVLRLMVEQYTGFMYQTSKRSTVQPDSFKNGGNLSVKTNIVKLLVKTKGKDFNYWMHVVELYSDKLKSDKSFRSNLASAINKALHALDDVAKRMVKNSRRISETKFTQEMFDERAIKRLREDSTRFEHEGKTLRELIKKGIVSRDSLTDKELRELDKVIRVETDTREKEDNSEITQIMSNSKIEIIGNIFKKLNDFVNVYMVDTPFGKMKLRTSSKKNVTKDTYVTPQITLKNVTSSYSAPVLVIEPTEKQPDENGVTETHLSQYIQSDLTADGETNPVDENVEIISIVNDTQPTPDNTEKPTIDEDDEEKAHEASSILSAASGNPLVSSIAESVISSIKNSEVQRKMKSVISSSFTRNSKKEVSNSRIGKILKYGLLLGKNLFTSITSGIKTFLTGKIGVVINLFKNSLKSSASKIARGAVAVKEGAAGIVQSIKDKSSEKKPDKPEMETLENEAKKIKRAQRNEKVKETISNVKTKVTDTASNIKDKIANSSIVQSAKDLGSKITDKFKNSKFGQGFMSAFEKKEKSRFVASSLTDQKTRDIDEMLSTTTGAGSIFSVILKAFDNVYQQAEDWFAKLSESEEETKKRREEKKKQEAENKKKKENKGFAFNFGKVLGGMMGILGGLTQAIMTVVLSLKGFKMITKLFMKTLTNILKPLNSAFKSIYRVIKPVMKSIQKVLKQLVSYVVEIVISIIDAIQPILEMIGPLLEQMMSILDPFFKLITDTVNVILIPLIAPLETVLVPVIQGISNTLDVILGVIQVGLGLALSVNGGILVVVGTIGKILGVPNALADQGQKFVEQGKLNASVGAERVERGVKGNWALAKQQLEALTGDKEEPEQEADQTNPRQQTIETLNGSPMDGLYGSGDANAPYKFDDNVLDALDTLKSLSSGIISLFTGDDTVEGNLQKEKDKNSYAKAQMDTANLSDEERKKVDDKAFELWKRTVNNEKLLGETDEEYRARYEDNKASYWARAAMELLEEKTKAVADGSEEGVISLINSAMGFNEDDKFGKMLKDYDNSAESGRFTEAMADFVMAARDDSGESYDEDGEWEYEYEGGGTGDIFQAASEVFVAARKAAGGDLHWNRTTVRNITFSDGMVIDKISPTHCTSMMAAIVKRMGYYLPSNGSPYTDTYQGNDQMTATSGGHGAISWGLQSSDGHPNIYDRNGKVSEDWICGTGNPQAGDITFGGIGGIIHGHMGAYKGADGTWFGFNGGADDSLASSVKLGEHYLKTGSMPTDTRLNPVPGKWFNDHQWTDQKGAIAYPMNYWVRYVGPKSKRKATRRKVRKTPEGGSGSSGVSGISASREEWIKTVCMVFEGYMNSGQRSYDGSHKYYDASHTHSGIKLRNGQVISARPDCSGMLGAAMTAFGYKLDYPPSSSHHNITGTNGTLDFIKNPDGSKTSDWQLLKFNGSNLEPGDITGNSYHASFPVTNLTANYPGGLDSGGDTNLVESAAAATAYLDGKSNVPWRSAMGKGAFSKGTGAQNIIRYVGGSVNNSKYNTTMKRANSTSSSSPSRKTTSSRKTSSSSSARTTTTVTSSSSLSGSSNAEKIWKYLRGKGYTAAGAAGLMGNLQAESALRPDNLEDSRQGSLGSDEVYTRKVDDGSYRNFTTDKAGYGLAQWTVSDRKGPLLEYKKQRGTSIADLGMQLDFLNNEFETKFSSILSLLKSTNDYKKASDDVLTKFERPKVNNFDARRSRAKAIYDQFKNVGGSSSSVTYTTTSSGRSSGSSSSSRSSVSDILAARSAELTGNAVPTSSSSSRTSSSTKRKTSTKKTTSSKKSKSSTKVSSGKSDWISTVAMMFEGYYYNGDKLYDNGRKPYSPSGGIHQFKIRDGRTVKARPDCSGMLGAAMTAFGYNIEYPPSSTHYNITGCNGNLNFITDANQRNDWRLMKVSQEEIQPGDILGNSAHATFPVQKDGNSWRGMDAGGTSNIQESAAPARKFLDGESGVSWRPIVVSNMQNILRYVGGDINNSTYNSTMKRANSKSSKSSVSEILAARSAELTGNPVSTTSTSKKTTTTKKKKTTSSSSATKSKTLTGSTTEEKIFNYLTRNAGMSEKGAAGMMGCMKYESGMAPNNLEDTYNSKFGLTDQQYTDMVDSKRESKTQFMYGRYATYIKGQTPGEAVGYGLTQFTSSSLKKKLYENTVEKGKSIADIGAQLDSVSDTLKASKVGSKSLFQTIKEASTPTKANQWFLWRYEAGTGYNSDEAVARAYPWMGMTGINNRHNAAEQYYRQYGSGDVSSDFYYDMHYNPYPMDNFMLDQSMFGQHGDDFITPDMSEIIPYTEPIGPMIIPDLPELPDDQYDNNTPTIVNKFKYVDGLSSLTSFIDEFLTNDVDVQSTSIRSLVEQISEEFPEYIEDYFSDDDEFTEEDDLLIQRMASVFI